jgi:hypothetical protein
VRRSCRRGGTDAPTARCRAAAATSPGAGGTGGAGEDPTRTRTATVGHPSVLIRLAIEGEALDDDGHGLGTERVPRDADADARSAPRPNAQPTRRWKRIEGIRPQCDLVQHPLTCPAGNVELVAGNVDPPREMLYEQLVNVALQALRDKKHAYTAYTSALSPSVGKRF